MGRPLERCERGCNFRVRSKAGAFPVTIDSWCPISRQSVSENVYIEFVNVYGMKTSWRSRPVTRSPDESAASYSASAHLSLEDDSNEQAAHHPGSRQTGGGVGRYRVACDEWPGLGQRTDATDGWRSDPGHRVSSQCHRPGIEDGPQRHPWRARAQPSQPHLRGRRARDRACRGSRWLPHPADFVELHAEQGSHRHRRASVQPRRRSRTDGGGRVGEPGARISGSLERSVRARVQSCQMREAFDCHHRQFRSRARHRRSPPADGTPSDRDDCGRLRSLRPLEPASRGVRTGADGRRAAAGANHRGELRQQGSRAALSRPVVMRSLAHRAVLLHGHAGHRRHPGIRGPGTEGAGRHLGSRIRRDRGGPVHVAEPCDGRATGRGDGSSRRRTPAGTSEFRHARNQRDAAVSGASWRIPGPAGPGRRSHRKGLRCSHQGNHPPVESIRGERS